MYTPQILTEAEVRQIPMFLKIEKKGMEAADKIITVSNLTRNIVIEKYGIRPEKT